MEFMFVVLIIGILGMIAIPNFLVARAQGKRNTCLNNLKQIETAKEQWAMDFRQGPGATPAMSDLLANSNRTEGYLVHWPVCPAGGTYSINPIHTYPTCSHPAHVLP